MIEPNPQGEVWVYAEHQGGSLQEVALELSGKARELADHLGVSTGAVLPGADLKGLPERLIAHGIDRVYAVEDGRLTHYQTAPYARIVCSLIEKHKIAIH